MSLLPIHRRSPAQFFTVSRLLKRWERDGVITKSRGIVHIIWPEKLLFD